MLENLWLSKYPFAILMSLAIIALREKHDHVFTGQLSVLRFCRSIFAFDVVHRQSLACDLFSSVLLTRGEFPPTEGGRPTLQIPSVKTHIAP